MTLQSVLKQLLLIDSISKSKNDVYRFRKGFFYTMGNTSEMFANSVKIKLLNLGFDTTDFNIINNGQNWRPFVGGASVKASSHWWVDIKFNTDDINFKSRYKSIKDINKHLLID